MRHPQSEHMACENNTKKALLGEMEGVGALEGVHAWSGGLAAACKLGVHLVSADLPVLSVCPGVQGCGLSSGFL